MAQILRPRHAHPRAPQTRAQIPHRSALLYAPHRIPNSPHAPHRPASALPAPRPAQRSANPSVSCAQKHLLADRLRPAAQRRARGLDTRACALGLRRDGASDTRGTCRARRRRGACISIFPTLGPNVPSSSPSRHTCPHRRKNPHGRHTLHTTRVSHLYTRCDTQCLTLCALLLIRRPLGHWPLLQRRHRPHHFHRPRRRRYRHWRPLLTARAPAPAQLLALRRQ